MCIYVIIIIIFLSEMATFQKIVGSFITTVDSVAQEVEKEKIKVSLIYPYCSSLSPAMSIAGVCRVKMSVLMK